MTLSSMVLPTSRETGYAMKRICAVSWEYLPSFPLAGDSGRFVVARYSISMERKGP